MGSQIQYNTLKLKDLSKVWEILGEMQLARDDAIQTRDLIQHSATSNKCTRPCSRGSTTSKVVEMLDFGEVIDFEPFPRWHVLF